MKNIFTALVLYRIAKGFILFLMLFSAYYSFTHAADFQMLDFPNYFRIQLSILKVLGAIILVVPSAPVRIRQWVYVAFATACSLLSLHISSAGTHYRKFFLSPSIAYSLSSQRSQYSVTRKQR
jgi:putative oxidoreductase